VVVVVVVVCVGKAVSQWKSWVNFGRGSAEADRTRETFMGQQIGR
jgi:hypothetical protein